jgi:hypothetical protein
MALSVSLFMNRMNKMAQALMLLTSVLISVETKIIPTVVGFTQPLQTNAAIVPQIRLQPLPSTSFPIHYLLINLPFYAI